MFPGNFEYHRASSVKQALSLLKQFGDEAKILSGGHSLLPMMKLRLAQPSHLIDITRIGELGQINEQGGKLIIGAAATHNQVANSELVKKRNNLLAQCAVAIGDVQVRNRGTIGGSLSHSDPAADYPSAILAADAEIKLEGENGGRTVKAEDFFVDLMTTAIGPGEILTQVIVPPLPDSAGCAYLKHRQPASGFAMVGVAAWLTLDRRGNCDRVRVGITGLGPKAFRAKAVENEIAGKPPTPANFAAAAAHAAQGVDPLSDIHASAEFRAELARVYTRRALEAAFGSARK
jgi:carbon-monoxide dehydrogenase medium subunit